MITKDNGNGTKTPIVDESAFAVLEKKPRSADRVPPLTVTARYSTADRPASTAQKDQNNPQDPLILRQRQKNAVRRPAVQNTADRDTSAQRSAAQNLKEQKAAVPKRRETPQTEIPRKDPQQPKREITPEMRAAAAERHRRISEKKRAEIELQKEIEREKQRRRRIFRRRAKNAVGYGVVFICLLLIICTLFLSCFLISATHVKTQKSALPDELTYTLETKEKNVPYADFVIDGVMYVNFSDIVNICSLSVSGDRNNLKFSAENDEFVSFTNGSDYCSVNGNSVKMESAAHLYGENMWIPLSFVNSYVGGVKTNLYLNENGKTVFSISRDTETEDSGTASVLPVSFLLKSESPLLKINGESLPDQPVIMPADTPTYEFRNDLTSFYPYMDPSDRNEYLLLVNPSKRADASLAPTDLVDVVNKRPSLSGLKMRLCAEKALEALFVEMYAAGFTSVNVTMAYRSYEAQEKQFNVYVYNERYNYKNHGDFTAAAYSVLGKSYLQNNYIKKNNTTLSLADGRRVAASYSAFPGTGDHQTGLGCDITDQKSAYSAFAQTDAYRWLTENAYKFGFVERYPKGKEKITGFSYEPCHWRFVGQYHAAVMHENGMCLEEYTEWLEKASPLQ
ncbi:MAG: M15 family metallopeptidase [Clostridia bacterium]|nr:M15 family metallopeptidase [Clostridia bacterium]